MYPYIAKAAANATIPSAMAASTETAIPFGPDIASVRRVTEIEVDV